MKISFNTSPTQQKLISFDDVLECTDEFAVFRPEDSDSHLVKLNDVWLFVSCLGIVQFLDKDSWRATKFLRDNTVTSITFGL